MRRVTVDVSLTVVVDIADEEAIDRALTPEWAASFYTFRSRAEVLEHLAYNCAANGIEDARRLDGWADLKRGTLTMRVVSDSVVTEVVDA